MAAARKPPVDNSDPATDLHTRLRAILGQVHKRADATLCRHQGAEFRKLALDLFIARQRATAALDRAQRSPAFAPAHENDALLIFPEIVELLLRLGSERASPGASSPRPSRKRKALKLFEQKRAASPRKSDKKIKAEIGRELKAHRSTVARWFPDKPAAH